jgi:hypothetical protein
MAVPTCHYCDRPAETECATCGRLYCGEHGADVCLRCMAPESAAPTAFAYRGSLLALAVASFVAIFLFIRPPEDEAALPPPRPVATNTPAFDSTATPTPDVNPTQLPTTTIATPTPTPEPEPTEGPATQEHEVQAGDTLSGIAEQYDITLDELLAANPGVSVDAGIQPGETLIIPGQ